jgi:hypothetical protein
MQMASGLLRWVASSVLLLLILNVFFESNVRTLIKERGWDRFLSHGVDKMAPLKSRRAFWFLLGLATGCAGFSWAIWGFDLGQVSPLVIHTGDDMLETDRTDGSRWLRLSVQNNAESEAVCQVFMTSLRKEGEADFIVRDDRLRLHAAYHGPQDFEQTSIYHGQKSFFDLTFVRERDRQLKIASDDYLRLKRPPLRQGTYRMQVELSGKNCGPAHANVGIKYDGNMTISVVEPVQSP